MPVVTTGPGIYPVWLKPDPWDHGGGNKPRLSLEDLDDIVHLRAQGFSWGEICEKYGVTHSSVHNRLHKLVTRGRLGFYRIKEGVPVPLAEEEEPNPSIPTTYNMWVDGEFFWKDGEKVLKGETTPTREEVMRWRA